MPAPAARSDGGEQQITLQHALAAGATVLDRVKLIICELYVSPKYKSGMMWFKSIDKSKTMLTS